MQEVVRGADSGNANTEILEQTMDGYRRFQVFKLAQEAGLFSWLEEHGAASAHRIVEAMQWSPYYGQALLRSLQEEGYLVAVGNRLQAAVPSAREAGAHLAQAESAWERLPAMLSKTSESRHASADPDAIWHGSRNAAIERDQLANAVLAWPGLEQSRRLLDLGGTEADAAMALCMTCPQLHAEVLVDRSRRAAVQRKLLDTALEQRIVLFEHDLDALDLQGSYDVVLAAHCFYAVPQAVLQVMETVAAHLRPGGLFVSQHSFEDGAGIAGLGAARLLERRIVQARAPLHYPGAYADRISSAGLRLLRAEASMEGEGSWLHVAERFIV